MNPSHLLLVFFLWQFSYSQNSGFFKSPEPIEVENKTENSNTDKRFFRVETKEEYQEEPKTTF